jgi:hypothetical protein
MRLTPGSQYVLVAMSRGAVLSEGGWRETWFILTRPGRAPERVHARGVNSLRKLAFIERTNEFDWRVATAGKAWLAANITTS